ncbi:hypothetical protein HOY82DRAFT_534433 [Tuber indicum]|nr:hypothetical protein HOY82DRAFT_534433 [Tuber indicum]
MSPFNYNWRDSPEESTNFRSSNWGDGGFSPYDYGNCGTDPRLAIPPGISDLPSSPQLPSQLASRDPGGSIEIIDSSPTGLSSIYANLSQDVSPSNNPYRIRSASPAQTTGYAVSQTSMCFDLIPSYPQYPIRQEQQQLASCFQGRGFYPNLDTGNLAPSPLPLHCQPARLGRKQGNVANYLSPGSHTYDICGIRCKRRADLYRHLKTARKHRAPHGPVCPEPGCKYTARFTRVDNFRAHYRRLHGKCGDEADLFIQEWKGRGSP